MSKSAWPKTAATPRRTAATFHVEGLEALFAEFQTRGLAKNNENSPFSEELHDGAPWKVFYVVAPDGLCYWFGQRQQAAAT